MFFNFFKRAEEKKEKEVVEYIDIIDDSGQKVKVDKKKWLSKLNELLDKTDSLISKCDMLDTAITYGAALDIVEICIKLYNENMENKRCVDLMFQCYVNNAMYKEAIEVYEKYSMQDGHQLTYGMYYELALSQEKIHDYAGMEKSLFLSFATNNNNTNAIIKLQNYIKSQNNEDYYYEWLKSITENSNSCYLCMELAELEYSRGNVEDGIFNLVKSLNLSNTDKHLVKVANILLSKKRYVEFENYILPKYDIMSDDIQLHQIVLNFYFKDNQLDKGLELLREMYNKGKYNQYFPEYEKKFLEKKLKLEKTAQYENLISNKGWGKIKNMIVTGPLYNLLFSEQKEKREGNKVLVLPFVLKESENVKTPEELKNFTKNIHLFLNDKMYLLTQLQNVALLTYDALGVKLQRKEYTPEIFMNIKEYNPNLDMILTGQIDVLDELGAFGLKIYTYDLNGKQSLNRFRANGSLEVCHQVINKFINTALGIITPITNATSEFKNVNDKKFMEYYTDYIDIVLNVNAYNIYKIYETDRILKYCIESGDKNNVSMALSLIYKQAKVLPEIKANYKQQIYDVITSNNYDEKLIKQFNYIYGEKIENEKI